MDIEADFQLLPYMGISLKWQFSGHNPCKNYVNCVVYGFLEAYYVGVSLEKKIG